MYYFIKFFLLITTLKESVLCPLTVVLSVHMKVRQCNMRQLNTSSYTVKKCPQNGTT